MTMWKKVGGLALVLYVFFHPGTSLAQEADCTPDHGYVNPMSRTPTVADVGSSSGLEFDYRRKLSKEVVRIPMRDGVHLYTEIYRPLDHEEPLPFILMRTPYAPLFFTPEDGYGTWLAGYPDLTREGYIFVFQDVRGTNLSEGEYVTLGPMRDETDPSATDESTDAYDTIDWLVNNVENHNGRVGTLGISYGGYLTTRALVNPHPALKATSPQATCADMFIGDDWHHNGAFRLEYAFDWIMFMETDGGFFGAGTGRYDNYEGFLELGPLSNINKKILHGEAPSWNAFTDHPNLDDYWRKEMCGVLPYIQPVTVPTLNVTGWFDAEDFYGPLQVYTKYEATDDRNLNYLVVGPWPHGGWAGPRSGRGLGPIDFGSNTSQTFRDEIQGPWFAYWLKGRGELELPEARVFRTGKNFWESYDRWPPTEGIERRNIYLRADGRLSFDAPTERDCNESDDYVSDPDNPVPYRPRPIQGHAGFSEWQTQDQRLADGRPDVLSYVSDPLEDDLTITGDPMANIFAATTGSDADWVVKLIDVYPDDYPPEPYMGGFQFMVAGEIFRGRYRKSYETPEAIEPGKITPYSFSLRDRNHTFRRGHRIMVQIHSTWFPIYDRNPQTYVDSIYEAVEADFERATQSICRDGEHPSHISLPVNVAR